MSTNDVHYNNAMYTDDVLLYHPVRLMFISNILFHLLLYYGVIGLSYLSL